MSRYFNPFAVAYSTWNDIAVASRTVEVNTKTGFSLTAGSYVLHASNNQRGTIAIGAAASSNTATISSVTTSRSQVIHTGQSYNNTTGIDSSLGRLTLTNSTTITATRDGVSSTCTVGYCAEETF
jgi:hypothetical protein